MWQTQRRYLLENQRVLELWKEVVLRLPTTGQGFSG
jgi:hypothetical protein